MIKSELKKVRSLLDESVKYVVPEYQRNFEWKKDQIEEFWDDVSSEPVFLGTIVLDVNNEKEAEISIVDGQQRITTIFIFLAACRYQAIKLNSHDLASAIQSKISFIDDTSGKASSSKLIPSSSIIEVFNETITNHDWDGKSFNLKNKQRQTNRIKPLYDFFIEHISKFNKDDLSELLKKLYESTFVKIEIEDTQDAFDIFERTNARGMELNAADLLKNYLFQNNNSKKTEEDWNTIIENSSGNVLRMIKYFYVSIFGLVQKKLLFKLLKKYGENIGASKLLSEMKDFSYFYSIIVSCSYESILEWAVESKNDFFRKEYEAKTLNRSLDALQLFGVTQAYPLIVKLLTIIDLTNDKDIKEKLSKKFREFIYMLEKFHFINYAICQRPGNQIEKYYADKCREKVNKNNFISFIEKINKELRDEKLVKEGEFVEKFSELTYGLNSNLIYYIFDRLNNIDRKGGQYIEIYNSDKKLLRRNYDIDHLISQNMDNYNFNEDEVGEYIDSIGNLLVISKHTNGSEQNKNIKEKLDTFKEMEIQNLPEVKVLINEWKNEKMKTSDEVIKNINERTKKLAKRAYNDAWKI
jgi:uncharacterized protein with ParB-like and HNH nuclease domain